MAFVDQLFNFVFVVELRLFGLVAEEQPVLAGTTVVDTLFHEGGGTGDARARADHDDVRVLVFGEDEGLGGRHEDTDGGTGSVDLSSAMN